jgi:imidazolonepropionase-like amidohydrolase
MIPVVPRFLWALWLASAFSSGSAAPETTVLAIRDVNVWDGTGAPSVPDRTVLVRGDRIAEIGPSADVTIPAGATVVDGGGRFLIPGLVDMHVHALWDPQVPPVFFPLFVANGVTTVRDMGGILNLLPTIRAALADGALLGPRLVAAGAILDGPEPVHPEVSIAVATPAEAVAAVESVAAAGADFVKVYTLLPADAFAAVVAAARERGLRVAGHAPYEVGAVGAAEAGMWTIEHLMSEVGGFCPEDRPTECAPALAAFRAHGTVQVPTLVLQGQTEATDLCGDPRLAALPRVVLEYWFDGATAPPDCDPAMPPVRFRPGLPPEAWIIPLLHETGIPILAGTDTGVPYALPGWSLHDELELLVEAGLPAADALRSATGEAARALGLGADIGTIEQGRVADLVLLRADPLVEIGNTRRIEAVVLKGRFLRRAELDSLLSATGIDPDATVTP